MAQAQGVGVQQMALVPSLSTHCQWTHFEGCACRLVQEFPPSVGAFATSSILHWSFAADSYWRVPDMATVLDIAKSIAVCGWREAGFSLRCFFL